MRREPRRDDYTICTAIAPQAVFTVRTYATTEPYEPDLVRTFRPAAEQSRRSATRNQGNTQNMSQVMYDKDIVVARPHLPFILFGGGPHCGFGRAMFYLRAQFLLAQFHQRFELGN